MPYQSDYDGLWYGDDGSGPYPDPQTAQRSDMPPSSSSDGHNPNTQAPPGMHWDPVANAWMQDDLPAAPEEAPPLPPAPAPTPAANPVDTSRDNFPAPTPSDPSQFPAPDPLQPWTGHFDAPTAESVTGDDGFKFRLGEGIKALQRSAASKGTLLTGGTMKDLTNYAQGAASQEYQSVYDRDYNQYETDRTDFLTNESNRYNSQRGNRMDSAGISSDYFNQGRANRMDDFNIYQGLDSSYWNKLLGISALGLPANPYA